MNVTFDSWTMIFLVASVQGLLLAYFIYQKRALHTRFLALLEVAFSVLIFYYVLYWTNFLPNLPRFVNLLGGLVYLFGPLLVFHIRPTTSFKFAHFIPAGAFVIYYFVLPFLPAPQLAIRIQVMLQILHLLIYSGWAWSMCKESLNRWLVRLFATYTATHLAYYLMVWTAVINPLYDYMISFAACGVMYFGGYMVLIKPTPDESTAPKYDKSKLSESAAEAILSEIKNYMEVEKGYLNNDLKLHQMAEALSLSANHISQVINELEGCNFTDFVNRYRIEEAKKLIVDNRKAYKIIQIAYMSGFNNKATFNSAFKKFVGMQPTRYKAELRQGK